MEVERCNSIYVTDSNLSYTDYVRCSKPRGHTKKEHSFTTTSRVQKDRVTYRWTDKEEWHK